MDSSKIEYDITVTKYSVKNNNLLSFEYLLTLVNSDAIPLYSSDKLEYNFPEGTLSPSNPVVIDFINLVCRSEKVADFTETSIIKDAITLHLGEHTKYPVGMCYTNTSKDILS